MVDYKINGEIMMKKLRNSSARDVIKFYIWLVTNVLSMFFLLIVIMWCFGMLTDTFEWIMQ